MMAGRLLGLGVGPGDPELMSVRADRAIRAARHVAYFRKPGRPGQARRIVAGMLAAAPQRYPAGTQITVQAASSSRVAPWTFTVRGTDPAGSTASRWRRMIAGNSRLA